MTMSRWICLAAAHALLMCPSFGQSEQSQMKDDWWQGLFRPEGADSVAKSVRPNWDTADVLWSISDELRVLDSLDKANPKPMQGYRVQIYFGDLQEARSIRAEFRREHPDTPCQLVPIDPNYTVTVGNYRDMWQAKRALHEGNIGSWRHALVIPSSIELPPLSE